MEFYSQYGQDKFLFENFFKEKNNGFYLDIGAHDGITLSNTYFFEKLGWDGVCFEPIPNVYEKLKTNRKCRTFNCALSDKKGYEKFLVLEGYTEMLSGIYDNYDKKHLSRIEDEQRSMGGTKKIIECQTGIFDDFNFPKHINYISLDVEGSELNILRTINFSKYSIDFMSIEVVHNHNEIDDLMITNNFIKIKTLECDYIYRNKITIQ